MRKFSALAILITMCLGLSSFVGAKIWDHAERLSSLEVKEENNKDLLKEVRDDVKTILQKL